MMVVLAVLLLYHLDRLSTSPIMAIINRWVRWITISFGVAYLLYVLEWVDRPYWVLTATVFLVWFLLETVYNWIAISALSRSSVPLFPKFEVNESGDEWPAQRRFIGLREWLRREGFKRLQAIRAELVEGVVLRFSVYENPDRLIRLQIMFLPHRRDNVSVCYILTSQANDGSRVITDNYFLPFGGFYPEKWSVERKPWTRSLPSLLKRHLKRMERSGLEFTEWEDDPIIDLNHQQNVLERVNVDLGFLVPRHLHEEYGKITSQGRYRFWKELWLLNYFGWAVV